MQTTYSIEIAAQPDRVFHWMDCPERVMQWIPNLIENESLHETPDKVGSTFRQVVEEHGRRQELAGVVTAYEKDRRLAIHLKAKGFELDVDYVLEPVGAGTRVTQSVDVSFHGVLKLIGPAMGALTRKSAMAQLERTFAKLKELSESGAAV